MNGGSGLTLPARAVLAYSLYTPEHRGKWRIVDRLVNALDLRPKGPFVVQRGGRKWALSPQDYSNYDLFWFGAKDRWDLHHLERLLPDNATVFDVGANFGYYSVMLASKKGAASHCFSFEPNPATFRALEENIRLNNLSNVSAFQMGLSDTVGTAAIKPGVGNSGASFLTDGDGIRTTTLDSFCAEHPEVKSIDFIKVDIEGFEERFLRGGLKTLQHMHPVILIELNPVTLPRAGSSVQSVVSLLRSLGYELFEVRRDRLVELTSLPSGEDHVNAICIYKD